MNLYSQYETLLAYGVYCDNIMANEILSKILLFFDLDNIFCPVTPTICYLLS